MFAPCGEIHDPRLFSRGTRLAEVPADFRGISWAEWERLCEKSWENAPQPRDWPLPEDRAWYRRGLATARSNYGMAGVPPSYDRRNKE